MFWENFYKLCLNNGLSANAVAKELNIASGTVTEWKKGRVPINKTLKKIANYFNVSIDYLLGKEAPTETSALPHDPNPSNDDILKDDFERKLIGTFRETTVDGKIRIINAAEEIKNDIEKNAFGGNKSTSCRS